ASPMAAWESHRGCFLARPSGPLRHAMCFASATNFDCLDSGGLFYICSDSVLFDNALILASGSTSRPATHKCFSPQNTRLPFWKIDGLAPVQEPEGASERR